MAKQAITKGSVLELAWLLHLLVEEVVKEEGKGTSAPAQASADRGRGRGRVSIVAGRGRGRGRGRASNGQAQVLKHQVHLYFMLMQLGSI